MFVFGIFLLLLPVTLGLSVLDAKDESVVESPDGAAQEVELGPPASDVMLVLVAMVEAVEDVQDRGQGSCDVFVGSAIGR